MCGLAIRAGERTVRAVLCAGVFLLFVVQTGVADFVLVENGQPASVIVLADTPAPAARQAADALRDVVAQMSGAELPIVAESDYRKQAAPVFVGASKAATDASVRVAQDADAGDRYVIRATDHTLALVGNDAGRLRGTAYAVYDLLERLGCGWFGPDPLWQVIPKKTTLAVPALDLDERPAFRDRAMSSLMGLDRALLDAWRLGGDGISHTHAFDRLVPRAEYADEHPDYFGDAQPCLTHPDVIGIITRQFREKLEATEGIVSFSLSANDALGFCDCARCRGVGNASALNLELANRIARNLARMHPGRYLLTFYAFWGTHDAPFPAVKAEPGVCVMQVNEGNHLHPWCEPERPDISQIIDRNNTRELIAFEGWAKTGAVLGIYEWWIPACDHPDWQCVPWYSGETALQNLRFWQARGVKYICYQTGMEEGDGFPLRWPLYYVGARGMWNPRLTAEQIMREACEKLYGPAAEPMQAYYRLLEQAASDCTALCKSWRLPCPPLVYPPEIESKATTLLDRAAVNADGPVRARVAQERALWQAARDLLADRRENPKGAQPSKANPGM